MSYKIGTVTYSTTGLKTIYMGTPTSPTSVDIIVQNKYGVNEGVMRHVSVGHADSDGQEVISYYKDNSGQASFNSTNKIISHYERVSGNITEVMAATFDSFTSSGIKLNITQANGDYLIYIKVEY